MPKHVAAKLQSDILGIQWKHKKFRKFIKVSLWLSNMTSLLSPKHVAYHLRLLEAIRTYVFALSRGHVKFVNGELVTTPAGYLLFCCSIHHLKLWITKVLRPKFNLDQSCKGLQDIKVPPFDVVVLLHSYMLHLHLFYEDSIRLQPEIAILSGFLFEQVVSVIPFDHIGITMLTTF
jgi:hypothetical protein